MCVVRRAYAMCVHGVRVTKKVYGFYHSFFCKGRRQTAVVDVSWAHRGENISVAVRRMLSKG